MGDLHEIAAALVAPVVMLAVMFAAWLYSLAVIWLHHLWRMHQIKQDARRWIEEDDRRLRRKYMGEMRRAIQDGDEIGHMCRAELLRSWWPEWSEENAAALEWPDRD